MNPDDPRDLLTGTHGAKSALESAKLALSNGHTDEAEKWLDKADGRIDRYLHETSDE